MKKPFLLLLCTLFYTVTSAQFVSKIKADSVLITNDSCTAELNLENKTRDTLGFLYNTGKGRTEFRKGMRKINDSLYLFGNDTLNLKAAISTNGTGTFWKLGGNATDSNGIWGTISNSHLLLRTNGITRAKISKTGDWYFGDGTSIDTTYNFQYKDVRLNFGHNNNPDSRAKFIIGVRTNLSLTESQIDRQGLVIAPVDIYHAFNAYYDTYLNIVAGGINHRAILIEKVGNDIGGANILCIKDRTSVEDFNKNTNNINPQAGDRIFTIAGLVRTFTSPTSIVRTPKEGATIKAEIESVAGNASAVGTYMTFSTSNGIVNSSKERLRITGRGSLLLGTPTDIPSSFFTISDTASGFLPPRLTKTQKQSILSPAIGLVLYQTDSTENMYINKSTGWKRILTDDDVPLIISGSFILDFANTSAGTATDLTITITGAQEGDVVSLGIPNGSVISNTCFTAWVSATDTITIRFNNYSSSSANPASGTFKVKILK